MAPNGILSSDPETFWTCYHALTTIPAVADAHNDSINFFGPGHPGYVFKGLGSQLWLYDESISYRPITNFYFMFFSRGTNSNDQMLELIEDTDKVLAESPLGDKIFIYNPFIIFWRVFLGLDGTLWTMVGISLGVIAVVSICFLCSPTAAFLGMIVSGMVVIDVWGIITLLQPYMLFNPFVVAICIAAGGMSVEFVSHTIAAFTLGGGNTSGSEKLLGAMRETFLPLIHGSFSTIFALLPLASSNISFLFKYFFVSLQVVVLIGLLHGFALLPAMLLAFEQKGAIEQPPAPQEVVSSHQDQPKKPVEVVTV